MRRDFHSTHLCEAYTSPVGRVLLAKSQGQSNRRFGQVRHRLRCTTRAWSQCYIPMRMFVP